MAVELPAEPPDGTMLVVFDVSDERNVIWRDDNEADAWYQGEPRGQHWWDAEDSDPMSWEAINKYTHVIHLVVAEPVWER